MIKQIFISFLTAIVLAPYLSFASYQSSIRIEAIDLNNHKNNFITIQKGGEKWLIHYKNSCGRIRENDSLKLVISGNLDGVRDTLWKGDIYHCEVDQAEKITGTMTVTTASPADNYTSVSDSGKPYRIYYSTRCKAMKGLNGKEIYVHKFGGKDLRVGDKFFLPANGEMCSITYLVKEDELGEQNNKMEEKELEQTDIKRPTTPTHLHAFPRNNSVYLYWRSAKDNQKIDHYLISTSPYHREDLIAQDPDEHPQSMPDTIETETNKSSYHIENLDPDTRYFFRVIAVDDSGNKSSYWSEEVSALTKSSIAEIGLKNNKLKLSKIQETKRSFLFSWTQLKDIKYIVVLEVDKKRVFINSRWRKNSIRILKVPNRKGRKMRLIVRSIDGRGISQKSSIDFTF